MSYPAHVTDTVYRYDGTFQGFFVLHFLEMLFPQRDPCRRLRT